MTNQEYTHLTLVVDRSGSMRSTCEAAQEGITQLLKEQFSLEGKFSVTLVEFDDVIDTVFRLSSTPQEYTLIPRNGTALFDAVGSELVATGEDLARLTEDDRPGKVVFVIVTDGAENASKKYNLAQVRTLIAEQTEKYQWTFQFIGAGESAWQGEAMGVRSASYDGSAQGMTNSYIAMSASLREFRERPDASTGLNLADIDNLN